MSTKQRMNSSNTDKHKEQASLLDYFKTWPLFLLPQHFLSSLIHRFMQIKNVAFKNQQISLFIKLFNVNMTESLHQDINQFIDFNHFFTRQLRADARIDKTGDNELCCPVDGAISEIGNINDEQLMQAKGHHFNLSDLLAGQQSLVNIFRDGSFTTIYLSPKDYHRIHMPIDGTLQEMFHVPGKLFGVNRASVKTIPRLFARNERVISIFDTPAGSMALIQVGAIFVSSIETTWQGVITPPRQKSIQSWKYKDEETMKKFEEMGRFNMGSTVILLFSKNNIKWDANLQPNTPVQLGQRLAHLSGKS